MEKDEIIETTAEQTEASEEEFDKGKVKVIVSKRKLLHNKERIADAIERLTQGDIETPFDTFVMDTHTRQMLKALEKLRLTMLKDKIAYEEQIDGFNDKIAGVAHDFKTPLTTIAGYAECIQDGIDDKDYAKLISERASAMNEQVIELVDDIRADRTERERSCVEAYGFFAGVFSGYADFVTSKKIQYKVGIAPKVQLYIDRKKITRVCQNIISNAVKATTSGGKISVKFRSDGKYLFIKIKDTGCGIKKADQPFVFDKFFTPDKARGSGNTGLGLYIVKEFVESHGGSVSMRSKVNHGTTFIVSLPIVYEESKLPSTRRFERRSRTLKLLTVGIFGFIMPFFFRLVRFVETYSVPTLLAALFLTIPFFLVFWFVDFLSVLVYGKITFLAD